MPSESLHRKETENSALNASVMSQVATGRNTRAEREGKGGVLLQTGDEVTPEQRPDASQAARHRRIRRTRAQAGSRQAQRLEAGAG